MTLVIGLANQQHTIFISDRRLTRAGKPDDEESNKAATLVCRDARVAICFSGLADVPARSIGRAKTFLTRQWLLEALVESAGPDYLMGPTISRFCLRATQDIETLAREHDGIAVKRGQPKLDTRLSVLLGGYSYAEDPPRCYFSLVSNFEKLDSQQPLAVASTE
ncbi:MAG TPA: hypothetical protein VMZ30_07855, partial [Pyrinomonadaceae bacterium]|nr:hypothetical protein [Pyrinomonadaceae bacterium]